MTYVLMARTLMTIMMIAIMPWSCPRTNNQKQFPPVPGRTATASVQLLNFLCLQLLVLILSKMASVLVIKINDNTGVSTLNTVPSLKQHLTTASNGTQKDNWFNATHKSCPHSIDDTTQNGLCTDYKNNANNDDSGFLSKPILIALMTITFHGTPSTMAPIVNLNCLQNPFLHGQQDTIIHWIPFPQSSIPRNESSSSQKSMAITNQQSLNNIALQLTSFCN